MNALSAFLLTASVFAVTIAPSEAVAEVPAVASPEELLTLLEALEGAMQKPRLVVLQGVPTASTAQRGSAFLSVSGTTKREGGSGIDGSLSFGLGFGDAREAIGGQLAANITSANPEDFADSGSFSLKLSRALPEEFGTASVGVTFDNLAGWGDASEAEVKASLALTFARTLRFGQLGERTPLLVNLGAASFTGYRDDWTPFAAIGMGLSENLSMTVAHNGDYEVLGVTTRLPAIDNLSLSASLLDVFDRKEDRRITLTVSYAFNDLF